MSPTTSEHHVTTPASTFFADACATLRTEFDANRAVLSFREYLDLAATEPRIHLRSAAQYLVDTFDHFGTYDKTTPTGTLRRFKLFDADFPEATIKVAGQEHAQNAIYQILKGFARDGRITRMILLHGPNGSAKTSIIDSIARGMEHYSRTPDGALYRFSWVFPSDLYKRGSIGFGDRATTKSSRTLDLNSYAHLTGDSLEATLPGDLSEHPLLLLPRELRQQFFERIKINLPDGFVIPELLLRGEPGPRSHAVREALMLHYGGDFEEVMKHVRVERFRVSRQFRKAFASVEPQLSVDAHARQITIDKSLQNLPPALSALNLFELSGALIDANRGLLEFNDLLKRPIDTFKYILTTCETGQIAIDPLIVQSDAIYIGSSNAAHLDAFKEYPDFQSFKARIELVAVPYLLRVSEETLIYEQRMRGAERVKPVAPHTYEMIALWAVLTRLLKPDGDNLPDHVKKLVQKLSPLEKLQLYDTGEMPAQISSGEARALRSAITALLEESIGARYYEGRVGASPRELHMVLLNALQNPDYACLSPIAVADELQTLCADPSVYEFLRIEPQVDYLRPADFIGVMLGVYLERVDREVSHALGLTEEGRFDELFRRYLIHVIAWARKEKVTDPISGALRDPDENIMSESERVLRGTGESADEFRHNLMATIGSFRLDNPDAPLEYAAIFPTLFRRMKEHYFEQKKADIQRAAESYLKLLTDGYSTADAKTVESFRATQKALESIGYNDITAREVIAFLLRERYGA